MQQPPIRHPLNEVRQNTGINAPARNKKFKSLTISEDKLSNPFKTALNIRSKSSSTESLEDDEIQKPLNFNSLSPKSKSPQRHIQAIQQTSNSSASFTPQRINTSSISQPSTPSIKSGAHSISPSPGVIRSKQNIPSPQRVPTISLRSFHTLNHIEFYKPIPLNQSRSTKFEIINETYDHKSVQLKNVTKRHSFNDVSCITIAPTILDLKRNQSALITVSCRPRYAMRITEVINIEWDLHSLQLHIHAVGFRKSMRTDGQKRRRKRTLKNMRKEDEDMCNSVESSMQSAGISSSSTIKSSARKGRKRSKRPMLSPTIRREKTFTAAPFSSPAPFTMRGNPSFMFNNNENVYDGLSVVNEENNNKKQCGFTPKAKRRIVAPIDDQRLQMERLCAAVIPIQAVVKCYLARKRMKLLLRHKQQQQERQQYYVNIIRSQLIMKRVHKKYMHYKDAVEVLQCALRTYGTYKHCKQYREHVEEQERQRILAMNQKYAACFIQSWFKSVMYRKMYIKHVQYVKMEIERERIQRIQTNASVYIQKWFRGTLYCACYRKYQMDQRRLALERQRRKEKKAAMYVQAWFKGVMCRKIYKERLYKKKEEERIHLIKVEHAAIYIQSWMRTMLYQSSYRQYLAHKREQERRRITRNAAIDIQSWYRTMLYQRSYRRSLQQKLEQERILHMRMQNAAIYIQSWTRTMLYQSRYKQYLARKREKERIQRIKTKNASIYIQSWFRTMLYRRGYKQYLAQKREQERQRIARSAAIYIQSWYRTMLYQRRYRQYLARKREDERRRIARNAAICIQSWYRSVLCRRSYRRSLQHQLEQERILQIRMQNAAIYIQSWMRTMLYRRGYQQYLAQKREKERIQRIKMENASIYIQSWFRTALYQRRYQLYLAHKREQERRRIARNAAIYIQSWMRTMLYKSRYRQYLARKREDERQRISRNAAIYIQSWYRTMLYKRRYRRSLQQKREQERILHMRMQNAAIYIQSWTRTMLYQSRYRQYLARKREKERIQRIKMENASNYIQSWFRTMLYRRGYQQYLAQKREQERQRIARSAAIYIQSWCRTVFYQRNYRIRLQQKREEERRRIAQNAAIYIQSWLRTKLYQRGYQQYLVQKREEARIERMKMEHAALYIQSWMRSMLYQRGYQQHLAQIREEERRRIAQSAATYIQSWMRTMLYKRGYQQYLVQAREERRRIAQSAAIYIQSWFRTMLYQRGYQQYLTQKRQEERQRIAQCAAAYIQSWFRSVMYRRNYHMHLWHKKQEDARLLREKQQQYLRCMLGCKRTRIQYLNIKQSCIVLQGVFKTYGMRKKYRNIRHSTKFIQCFIRGKLWRHQYLNILHEIHVQKQREKREAVLGVLSLWRLRKFHNIIQIKHRQMVMFHGATTFIQSWFRGSMFHKSYNMHISRKRDEERMQMERMRLDSAATYIQSWLRSILYQRAYQEYIAQKREEERKRIQRIQMEAAAIYIQSWFKGVMYRKMYVQHIGSQSGDYQQSVIRIQALMRGKLVRMECCRNKQLLQLLKNVRNAHKKWHKKKTVNYLLDDALNKLMKSRSLYGVSEACDTLETLLKVVPNVSHRIVEHNIIGALYHVLRNSNRSEPHLYLVKKILNFMLFFAQHDVKCYESIFYRDDTLEILSERLQIHRLDFVLFELTTQLFFVGVDVEIPFKGNKFLIDLRKSDVNRQIRTVQKIMCSKLEIAKRVNRPLRYLNNAKTKYKKKFQQEKTLSQCVQNMNKLVDRL